MAERSKTKTQAMTTQYKQLISKLDNFIRKYYINQIIRGVLLSLILWSVIYLFISVSEYYAKFSIPVRTTLFYTTILIYAGIFLKFIIIPLLNLVRIGKVINHKQAAVIISKHFGQIEDKLLNTLELANNCGQAEYSKELILASIEQKINEIKLVPFKTAIKFKDNLKYVKYLVAIIIVGFGIYFLSPDIITKGSERIIKHDTYFKPEAPFKFVLLNDTLNVKKGGNFKVKVKAEGKYIPNEISLYYGGNSFLMKKISKSEFNYEFKNINNSLEVYFFSDNIRSEKYKINVLPTPVIINFDVALDIPVYTGEKSKTLNNIGDLTVPVGTKVKWVFKTKDMDSLFFTFQDSSIFKAEKDSLNFVFNKRFLKNTTYELTTVNQYFEEKNIVKYSINLIPDLYPTIEVISQPDSLNRTVFYYKGNVSDDYGVSRLTFNYMKAGKPRSLKRKNVPINRVVSQEFFYGFDFAELNLKPGDKIEYYFQVWDNDQVNGRKSSRSHNFEFKIPSEKELATMEKQANENIKSQISKSQELVKEIREDISKLQQSMIDNSTNNWEKTRMLNQIAEKQKTLQQMVKQISEKNKEKNETLNTFTEEEMAMLEKQKQLEKLMENLLTDEMKEMIEELNKMAEKFDEKKLNELSKDIEMSYEDLSEQLDRNLELLKHYEVEKKIEDAMNKISDLAKEQEKLAEETKDGKKSNEELAEKQKEIQEKFEQAQIDYQQAEELNKQLEKPKDLENFDEMSQDINQEMQEGNKNLQKGKENKASQNQKNASQKMQKMAEQMMNMMSGMAMQQNMEDIDDLRQILENLISFSFDQESIMEQSKTLKYRDPRQAELLNWQKKISDNFTVIKDSLNALAKRTPQITSMVNKELISINKNMERSLYFLEEHRKSAAQIKQQFVMTSANELALMLSEVLDAMQNQSGGGAGGGMSAKQKKGQGKDGKESFGNMKQQQEALKKQLEQMLQQMKQDGKGGKGGKKGMSKQFAKGLAEQEKMQQMLQQMMNNGKISPEAQKELKKINKMMEETKKEIANKVVDKKTINRQAEIMTRMLEAEKAEKERETEKKRESKKPKEYKISNPQQAFDKSKDKLKFRESLKTTNLKLFNYYKNKYKEYLKKLNK